jgi:hypothetical protein
MTFCLANVRRSSKAASSVAYRLRKIVVFPVSDSVSYISATHTL